MSSNFQVKYGLFSTLPLHVQNTGIGIAAEFNFYPTHFLLLLCQLRDNNSKSIRGLPWPKASATHYHAQ